MNTQFIGTGRVGRDPELRFTPTGKAVLDLAVAFSNTSKIKGTDDYKETDPIWVSITLWDKMANNAAEVLSRGDEVLCAGSLEIETFEYTRGERAGEKGTKYVLKNAEVAPSIRRKLPKLVGDLLDAGAKAVQRSDKRRPPVQHRTPDPVGARAAGSFDDL